MNPAKFPYSTHGTFQVAVRILPRGTVSLEDELGPRRQGTITVVQLQQKQQQQKRFGHGRSGRRNDRGAPQYRGKLVLDKLPEPSSEEAVQPSSAAASSKAAASGKKNKSLTHPFLSSDVVGDIVLGVGDVVSVTLMQHKRTKKIRVAKVVLEQLGGERETGIVHTTRDAFGFIE